MALGFERIKTMDFQDVDPTALQPTPLLQFTPALEAAGSPKYDVGGGQVAAPVILAA